MTVFNVFVVLACTVIGVFLIKYGNTTLHKQQKMNRRRISERVWMQRERSIQDALDALHYLSAKRESGLVVISDESWADLERLYLDDPRYVIEIAYYLEAHVYRSIMQEQSVSPLKIISEVEVTEDVERKRNRRRDPDREPTPRGGLMIQPSTA